MKLFGKNQNNFLNLPHKIKKSFVTMEEKISAIRDELSALKGLVNGLNEKISSIESLLTSLTEENSLPEFEVEPEAEAVPDSGQELELDETLFETEHVFEPVQETVSENKSEGRKTLPEDQEDDGMPVFMLYDYDWMKDRPGLPVNDMRSAVTLNDRVEFINSLFDGDPVKFQNTVLDINGMKNMEELVEYLVSNGFKWDMESDAVYRFMMAARRKLG